MERGKQKDRQRMGVFKRIHYTITDRQNTNNQPKLTAPKMFFFLIAHKEETVKLKKKYSFNLKKIPFFVQTVYRSEVINK